MDVLHTFKVRPCKSQKCPVCIKAEEEIEESGKAGRVFQILVCLGTIAKGEEPTKKKSASGNEN